MWLVDLETETLARRAIGSDHAVVHRRGDTVTTPLLPGFAVTVDEILDRRPTAD